MRQVTRYSDVPHVMRTASLMGFAALVVITPPLQAQACDDYNRVRPAASCEQPFDSRLEGHVKVLGINMVLGAATVGIAQALKGGSFWEGAAAGALGGGLSYAGKLVVTAEFAGSGLAGRELAALGSSVISNTMNGDGILDRAILPVGPLRFELQRVPGLRVRTRVDLPNLVVAFYSAAQSHVDLDWSASVSAGALVFIDRAPATDWAGRHIAGVIVIKDAVMLGGRDMDRVLRHERVHLLQHDFTYTAWGRPAQAWLLQRGNFGAQLHAFMDLRLDMLGWLLLNALLSRDDRPSEREAYFLVPSDQSDGMPAFTATRGNRTH